MLDAAIQDMGNPIVRHTVGQSGTILIWRMSMTQERIHTRPHELEFEQKALSFVRLRGGTRAALLKTAVLAIGSCVGILIVALVFGGLGMRMGILGIGLVVLAVVIGIASAVYAGHSLFALTSAAASRSGKAACPYCGVPSHTLPGKPAWCTSCHRGFLMPKKGEILARFECPSCGADAISTTSATGAVSTCPDCGAKYHVTIPQGKT